MLDSGFRWSALHYARVGVALEQRRSRELLSRNHTGGPQPASEARAISAHERRTGTRSREIDAEIVATGRDPNRERRERRQPISLGELFERYRTDYLIARGKPTGNADQYWRDYLAPWSSKPLADISPEMVMALHQDIPRRNRRRAKLVRDKTTHERKIVIYPTKQKVSEGMANRVIGFLSALYGWATRTIDPTANRRYFSGVNPASLVVKYSESPDVGRPITEEEMKRFLDAVMKLAPFWRDFFLTLAWTGARLANRFQSAQRTRGRAEESLVHTPQKRAYQRPASS